MSHVVRIAALLLALTVVGTLGFYLIEDGYSLFDSLYMTVITLTTVGYGEVQPLSPGGRVFVMVYLVLGLGVFLFGVVSLGELVVENRLARWLERRRMDSNLRSLRNHYIVCGFGRMGQTLARELAERRLKFVVIDSDPNTLVTCQEEGWHWIVGDATDDEVLLAAGVEGARGLAAVLGSDADNLFIVVSARLLAKDLRILARASGLKQAEKLEKAGADRVVSPYAAGAAKIAQLLASPHVEDFMEIVTAGGSELDLAQVQVGADSAYADQPLAQTDFAARGVIIVGIRREGGEILLPPSSTTVIRSGDSLIALGNAAAIRELLSRT